MIALNMKSFCTRLVVEVFLKKRTSHLSHDLVYDSTKNFTGSFVGINQ